jgi:hypothetical protein
MEVVVIARRCHRFPRSGVLKPLPRFANFRDSESDAIAARNGLRPLARETIYCVLLLQTSLLRKPNLVRSIVSRDRATHGCDRLSGQISRSAFRIEAVEVCVELIVAVSLRAQQLRLRAI